jgi:hypothetical protein
MGYNEDDIDPGTGQLYSWSNKWNEADPRITTLKLKSEANETTMNNLASTLVELENDHKALVGTVDEYIGPELTALKVQTNLISLYIIGKIDSDQCKSLYKMLQSVDAENHTVAKTTIENLMKEL